MRERPILFSAPMVLALLAGTKTQTRRVVKGLPLRWLNESGFSPDFVSHPENALCPYGQPGHRLWVRETWAWSGDGAVPAFDRVRKGEVWFRADPERTSPGIRWRPSIYMPRWASRITLEVTCVRVERLQDITAEDAQAEGISEFVGGWWCEHDDAEQIAGMTPQEGYRHLWDRINGPGSWDTNPWVWVVEFRRLIGGHQ